MNEHDVPVPLGDPTEEAALRYALGDLPRREAAAFEQQLAGDQDAREALASMMALIAPAAAPGPGYRAAVRRRLRLGRALASSRRLLTGAAAVGLAATILLIFRAGGTVAPAVAPAPPPGTATPGAAGHDAAAAIFADVSGIDRLECIHLQRTQRQHRRDDFRAHHPIFDAVRTPMSPMSPMSPMNPMMPDGPMMWN
jgi:hypothetical protein